MNYMEGQKALNTKVIDMSKLRLIHTVEIDVKLAKVYRDSEWQEYRVKFYVDGVYQVEADYHTEHKQDAIDTADEWAEHVEASATLATA